MEYITHWLEGYSICSPKDAINMWILTQELNITVLRDLSLALCLDRFDDLPVDSICELSRENFLNLVGNINVRSTESNLLYIRDEWMNHHQVSMLSSNTIFRAT